MNGGDWKSEKYLVFRSTVIMYIFTYVFVPANTLLKKIKGTLQSHIGSQWMKYYIWKSLFIYILCDNSRWQGLKFSVATMDFRQLEKLRGKETCSALLLLFCQLRYSFQLYSVIPPKQLSLKGLVNPKMKIRLCFSHLRRILGVCDFLLSDESNRSYIKKIVLAPPSLSIGINGCLLDPVRKTWNSMRIHKAPFTQRFRKIHG